MGQRDLTLSVAHHGDETVVTLAGELDGSNADELSAVVTDLFARAPGRIVLDLAELAFCDSRGLGTLIVLSRAAQLQQSFLQLRRPTPSFDRMLDITGVRAGLNIAAV